MIAIFSGFHFHYEMFGYIIHYCNIKQYKLTIYCHNTDMGFIEFYKSMFDATFKPLYLFEKERDNYKHIFLTTDDDDYRLCDTKKTICIDHYYKIRSPIFEKRVATRPFSKEYYRNWALPIYPIDQMKNKIKNKDEINIVILGDSHTNYNTSILNRIKGNIVFHGISRNMRPELFPGIKIQCYRNISTSHLFHIVQNSDYIITDLTEAKNYTSENMSGAIPIAFSTLTPLIISKETNSYYQFKNVIEFNSTDPIELVDIDIEELKKERDESIYKNHALFDSFICLK